MAHVGEQISGDGYQLYNGDSCEVWPKLPGDSLGLTIYSPPFRDLYRYSSSDRDLGNCRTPGEFTDHYRFIVEETFRTCKRGRMVCVHCMDLGGNGKAPLEDFTGEIIALHQAAGFDYWDRKMIWKEPWRVARKTRSLSLRHKQVVEDASWCRSALPDYLLVFRKPGEPEESISHPDGFGPHYPGEFPIFPPAPGWEERWRMLVAQYEDFDGDQRENKLSHAIWRRLASSLWDDIRIDRLLPFRDTKDEESEKHVCPLQLDVIERAVTLWSIDGDVVGSPFAGIGSEPYGALSIGRRAVGCELKPIYYKQAKANCEAAAKGWRLGQPQQLLDFALGEDG